jgi:DNA polymerase (family 10)
VPVHNRQIADMFGRLADLLEIEGANPFRVRAYRNAARVVGGYPRSLADRLAEGADLTDLSGIGEDLAAKIQTIVRTGRLPKLEEVEKRTPPALTELMKVPGLGPKRVKALYQALNVRSLEDLRRALRAGRVRELPGFGAKTEAAIREGIDRAGRSEQRTLRPDAEEIAAPLLAHLQAVPGVKDVALAGSYRRCRETVGDLDILVTCRRGAPVMQALVDYDEVETVAAQGNTRSTVILASGLQVDLRVVPQVSWGAALHYFTGAKAHNIAVRRMGAAKGLKINEYGVFRGERRVAGRTEEEVFAQVGLPYIVPELREDRGEIEAALAGTLPALVTLADIRGDLHAHTAATDGQDSLEAMARAAHARGYEYLAITDHSRRVAMAHGLDRRRLAEQIDAIDALNERLAGLVVLKGIEVDILEDGSLDLPDSILDRLDVVVCSVHYQFALPRPKQTTRILRALDNPRCNILAHPTGRLLNERAAYDVDLEAVLTGAKERGCAVELNAQPSRLDLDDLACRMAKEIGVLVAISTDAHSTGDLDLMRFGVGQARRGWLEAKDVINTRPLAELRKLLKRN